jgi:hypothetical protein
MHEKLKTSYARRMKKLRQSTVEPVLGTLINFMGLRRIWTRGLKQANKFMIGAAMAYNLKKWLIYRKSESEIVEMRSCLGYNDLLDLPSLYLKPLFQV